MTQVVVKLSPTYPWSSLWITTELNSDYETNTLDSDIVFDTSSMKRTQNSILSSVFKLKEYSFLPEKLRFASFPNI